MKLPQRLAGASSLFEHQEEIESAIDVHASPSVVDELGIGLIRDSFSDTLFPGISTMQTRAKYFLTLPRIFRDYELLTVNERRRISLADYLTQQENLCMMCLNQNHNSDPQEGIIGASYARKSGEVHRKPSSLYWNGLRTFGLIKTTLSLQEFVKSFANPDTLLLDLFQSTDETKNDASESVVSTPPYSEKWQEQLTLHLSCDEATFLVRQIEMRVHDSLFGLILMDDTFRTTFVELPESWQFADFCNSSLIIDQVSNDLKRALFGARDFWQILKGAHIRYNVLLQRKHGTDEMRVEFEKKWTTWCGEMSCFPWDRWNPQLIWDLLNRHRRQLRDHTKRFVRNWIESVQNGTSDVTALDDLVTQQELLNKKARARLKPNAVEQIKGWVGIESVDYRYSQVRTIIKDIHNGLTRQHEKADA